MGVPVFLVLVYKVDIRVLKATSSSVVAGAAEHVTKSLRLLLTVKSSMKENQEKVIIFENVINFVLGKNVMKLIKKIQKKKTICLTTFSIWSLEQKNAKSSMSMKKE